MTLNKAEEVVPVLLSRIVFKANLELLLKQLGEFSEIMLHDFFYFLVAVNFRFLHLLLCNQVVVTSKLVLLESPLREMRLPAVLALRLNLLVLAVDAFFDVDDVEHELEHL